MYSTIHVLKELERSTIEGSYLLAGEDEFMKEKALTKIVVKALPEDADVLNRSVFYGNSATSEEISSALFSIPMMASKKVVIIREAHRLDASAKDAVLKYLSNQAESTCLILLIPKTDLEKGVFNTVSRMVKVYQFPRLTRSESSQFVLSYLRKHEMGITDEARELLLESVGSETTRLVSELDKLISYKGRKECIDKHDIERLVDFGRLQSIFKLQDFVGRREVRSALLVIDQLLAWNERPMRILASLGTFYLTLLRLKQEPNDAELGAKASRLRLSRFYLRKCAVHLSNFSEKQLISALALTNRKELEIKEGAACLRPLLTTYISQLCSL
jgi:DNA polymerase-3 subunit delta